MSAPYTCPLCHGARTGDTPVIKSDGMGVESVAITLRWLAEPETRDFCLCQLVVITAQTGDEHADTIRLMEQHVLPLYRRHHIRFVEVARAGHSQADGIVVLQDTRQPYRLHREGAYRLSEELITGGTVPQFGGEHRCALKFKAFVIETWLTDYFAAERIRQVFGYNVEEPKRAAKCVTATERRNAENGYGPTYAVFGFNADEQARADRAQKYDGPHRTSVFPLIEWAERALAFAVAFPYHAAAFVLLVARVGSREWCLWYIFEWFGVWWEKSACVYCPFNSEASKQTDRGMARLAAHPEETAEALMLEHMSLAMNPRGLLYAKLALRQIAPAYARGIYEGRLDAVEWRLYRVRRVYSRKGKADRCVEVQHRGTRARMTERLAQLPGVRETRLGIEYVYVERRGEVYPAFEEFYVAAPGYVADKARYGLAWFEAKWQTLRQGELLAAAEVCS